MRLPLRRRTAARPLPTRTAPIAVPCISGAEISAIYHGERRGGDFYDFVRVAPHLVLFGLLDVAGRHQENQSIVAAAQRTFRRLGNTLFSRDDINEAESMIELSLEINRSIMEAAKGVRSCPAFVGCYNETVGTVCYSNAGHTPALLRDGSAVTPLLATGLPFGLFSHVTHDAPTVAVSRGSALLLVSRGVTEAKCGLNEYGLVRVQETLSKSMPKTAEQLCRDILGAVDHFICGQHADNDVTALALLRSAAAVSAGTAQ